MTVKVIGLIKVIEPDAFETYRSKVGATVEKFKGKIVHRGALTRLFWNDLKCDAFDSYVEIEFPLQEDASSWAASDDYKNLIDVRSKAMQLTLFAIN